MATAPHGMEATSPRKKRLGGGALVIASRRVERSSPRAPGLAERKTRGVAVLP